MTQKTSTSERKIGGLWGAIIGDALGVPVEFVSREARRGDPVTGMRGYGTHQQPPGTWSDDSSLLLCTVEALCELEYRPKGRRENNFPFFAEDFRRLPRSADEGISGIFLHRCDKGRRRKDLQRMGSYFRADPKRLARLFLDWQDNGHWTAHGTVFDIGNATSSALSRIRQGVSAEEAGGTGELDNGNGSLMRILPVALKFADAPVEEMLLMAHRISAITHRHPRSQMACGLYCTMAKGLLEGLSPFEAYHFMIEQCQRYYQTAPFIREIPHFARILSGNMGDAVEREINSSGYVVHTMEASIWCLLTTVSFEEAVLKAVNLGDDTDTTGCVTGGLAGLYYGLPSIPHNWITQIVRQEDVDLLLKDFIGN